MRLPPTRSLAVAVLGGVWSLACSPTPTTGSSNVCGSAAQACSASAECCPGFQCANGSCQFVGGNGGSGNGNGNGNGSSGQATSRGSSGSATSSLSNGSSSSGFGTSSFSFSSASSSFGSSSSGFSSRSSSRGGSSSGTSSSFGNGSSSSGFSGSSGSAVCATTVVGYPAACTAGSATCPAPTQCIFDPVQDGYFCLYTCNVSADCPDNSTHCVGGNCVENGCGGTGDGGVFYPGTLNGTCNAAGVDDGTCAPAVGFGFNSPGFCLQAGGSSTTSCGAFVRCGASQMCQTLWACSGTAQGPGGTCIEFCDPSGANTCPSGQTCQLQSDGESGNCVAGVADAGGILPVSDGGASECDTSTCTGCPSGETCYCVDLSSVDGGLLGACSASNQLCELGLPGFCQ